MADKEKAAQEKELGNKAYKNRDFQKALTHYQKAIELDRTDMRFLLNLAVVYKEQGEFQKCADTALKAVDVGLESHDDYKIIARAFSRAAMAYSKMEELGQAKDYYEKSLSLHNTPETRSQLSEVEKAIEEAKVMRANMDPEKAEEERTHGNRLFKRGDYHGAVEAYSEAIRLNPDDPKAYGNRAACYNKMAAFNLGVKDCDKCIRLDPKFVKAYVRKGIILQTMKQYENAMGVFEKAIQIDEHCAEALAGYRECLVSMDTDPDVLRRRAMDEPDIEELLDERSISILLGEFMEDSENFKKRMKHRNVTRVFRKLVQSGYISFR